MIAMKVLFVCRQNVGRSQMAAAFYNQLHPGDGGSAGTIVDIPGQKLQDFPAKRTIAAMRQLGIDVSQQRRTQLTPALAQGYDKIVVMAEPENTPGWLAHDPRTEIWDIKDTKDTQAAETERIRDQIKARVEALWPT